MKLMILLNNYRSNKIAINQIRSVYLGCLNRTAFIFLSTLKGFSPIHTTSERLHYVDRTSCFNSVQSNKAKSSNSSKKPCVQYDES